MTRLIILAALVLCAIAANAYEIEPDRTFADSVVPVDAAEAPATVIDTPTGETTVAAYASDVRVVTVWATWCEVCAAELPVLARAARHYAGRGVAVMPVSVDDPPALMLVEAYLEDNAIDLPVMHDRDFALATRIGVTGTPTTIIVDRFDQVVAAFLGQTPWKDPALHDYLLALAAAETAEASRAILPD